MPNEFGDIILLSFFSSYTPVYFFYTASPTTCVMTLNLGNHFHSFVSERGREDSEIGEERKREEKWGNRREREREDTHVQLYH